ncbi:methyl-accepting chemotaxis protein [Fundidesulfovibrio terrae]|uniref:methyl-accepting chemotaxis protein n=1 Tax=Fundidesulfovibrio terrae TaxID=2922866 RepID=UPI001FAFEB7E|nr:methyl-accepting chemotaxis protein [Fundidesulfovibrio terrae]
MSISLRIYTGYSVILALSVFIWFVGYSNSARMGFELANITDVNMKALAALKDVKFSVRETIAALRSQLIPAITPEFRAAQKKLYSENTDQLKNSMAQLEGLTGAAKAGEDWNTLLKEQQRFLLLVEKVEAALDEWSKDTSDVLLSMEVLALAAVDLQKQSDVLLSVLDRVIVRNDEMIAEDNRDAKSAISTGQFYALMALCMAGGVAAVVGWLITRNIRHPLSVLVKYAGDVASGNLDVKAEGRFIAELDLLKMSLGAMVDKLKEEIRIAEARSRETAEQAAIAENASREAKKAQEAAETARQQGMTDAAEELAAIVEKIFAASQKLESQVAQASKDAQVQKQRLEGSLADLGHLDFTTQQVSRGASEAASTAAEARGQAQEGAQVIREVVDSIHAVETKASSLKANMTDLSARAEGIGRIMTVISDIADQTNLLALNAAIEAARAGDAGRGFAVVADEVRKLAEKTMNATREVDASIKGIQDGTQTSGQGVDQAVEAITHVASQVDTGGSALGMIVELSQEVTRKIRLIDEAVEQQTESSRGVSGSIQEISHYAEETAEAMSQARDALENLGFLVDELRGLMRHLQGR